MSLITVKTDAIQPSQDFLKPGTVKYIFDCIEKGEFDKLPPNPIVREDEEGQLIAIDGHNLIAVKAYMKEEVSVHVASSSKDGIEVVSDADQKRNEDLLEKFDTVISKRDEIAKAGTRSFKDLIATYPELFPDQ